MTSDEFSSVHDAARLLRIALNPRETAARSSDYQQLLQRFHTDSDFRDVTRHIARGLDLQVFELARDLGLAIVNIAGGPYAPTLDDFKHMRGRERIVYGLLIAMLTAYVYPTRRSLGELDDNSVVSIELRPLVEWAASTTKQLKSASNLEDVLSEDHRAGFEAIGILDCFGEGQNTLQHRFRFILQWLSEHGLFLCREEGGKELWIARPHFRVQARHLMSSVHDRLIALLAAQTAVSGNGSQ